MLKSLKMPSETQMNRRRYTSARHRYTICSALREAYFLTDDPEIKFQLRYATMLATEVVDRLAKYDITFVKKLYPRIGHLDKFR